MTGVLLVFIDEKGHAIAHAADFEPMVYGGCELAESQHHRARRQLALNVCAAYASPMFVRAVDAYQAEQLVDRLVHKFGCKVHRVDIGGSDAAND